MLGKRHIIFSILRSSFGDGHEGFSYGRRVAVSLMRVRSLRSTINASMIQSDASGRVGSVLSENTTPSGGLSMPCVTFIKSQLKRMQSQCARGNGCRGDGQNVCLSQK